MYREDEPITPYERIQNTAVETYIAQRELILIIKKM